MAEPMLVIREGEEAGREVPLTGPLTIGRGDDADLKLPDTGISRSHARVTPEGLSAVIEDLGSSNGTYVNTERVVDPRRLRDGDEIHLGNAVLAFATGTEETRLMEESDPDATEAHPGPGAATAPPTTPLPADPGPPPGPATAAGGAAAAAGGVDPAEPASPDPFADADEQPLRDSRPWDPIPMPKPKQTRAPRQAAAPRQRREPASQADPRLQGDAVNDWNIPAWLSLVLGLLSIALIIFSSGSGFYAALPVAVAGIALGTIGRNKAQRGEATRFGAIASFGRTFSIVGTILAAVILVAVIAVNQLLDVSTESIADLIDEIRLEIESN